jgi:hypothetical protein
MRKIIISALLGWALTLPTAIAQTPAIQTKSYVYEWIHLRARVEEGLRGWLFIEDLQGTLTQPSHLQGFLKDIHTGEMIFDCSRDTDGFGFHTDVIQVGPFAQQARGDIAPIQQNLDNQCRLPPQSLTLDCPYQGVPAPQAAGHESFNHTGTYRNRVSGLPGSYSQVGQHGPTACTVVVNGIPYGFEGHLTRIKETRRGQDVSANPTWIIPRGWVSIEELAK